MKICYFNWQFNRPSQQFSHVLISFLHHKCHVFFFFSFHKMYVKRMSHLIALFPIQSLQPNINKMVCGAKLHTPAYVYPDQVRHIWTHITILIKIWIWINIFETVIFLQECIWSNNLNAIRLINFAFRGFDK